MRSMIDKMICRTAALAFLLFSIGLLSAFAQEFTQPVPGPAKSVNIPAVKEIKLSNGLTVAVIEKKGTPIVSVQLLVGSGASKEGIAKAGLADMTADMLTKGTATRTADQVAGQMEFLGTSLNAGAGWASSVVSMTVTTDKLDAALGIMSDVVLVPAFKADELDLLKTQTLDELKFNLTQPGFLGNYVASVYSFGEHPTGGTPQSIEGITRKDITDFYAKNYTPDNSVLIFTGDITSKAAGELAERSFGKWAKSGGGSGSGSENGMGHTMPKPIYRRILVVDLPNSGQASVGYFKNISGVGRGGEGYFTASVLNSILGGGYSSRLNQEIRIKRGLSYGAGSSFAWRGGSTNFGTRTQTKTQSAAEVAELVVAELKRLTSSEAEGSELTPRKLVLTGGFDRSLETTGGLGGALADLNTFGLAASELNTYSASIGKVGAADVKKFAASNFVDGDIIIVGDYSVFKNDLAKRFPNDKVDVIKIDELDITRPGLRKQ